MTEYREISFTISLDADTRTVLDNLARLNDICDLHLDTLELDMWFGYISGMYCVEEYDRILRFVEGNKAIGINVYETADEEADE